VNQCRFSSSIVTQPQGLNVNVNASGYWPFTFSQTLCFARFLLHHLDWYGLSFICYLSLVNLFFFKCVYHRMVNWRCRWLCHTGLWSTARPSMARHMVRLVYFIGLYSYPLSNQPQATVDLLPGLKGVEKVRFLHNKDPLATSDPGTTLVCVQNFAAVCRAVSEIANTRLLTCSRQKKYTTTE